MANTHLIILTILNLLFFISPEAYSAETKTIDISRASTVTASPLMFNKQESALLASGNIFVVCNVIQQASETASLDIVKLIAAKSGLKLESSPLSSWSKALQDLKTGKCDILPWVTKSEARSKIMNFTRPYVRIKRVVIARKQENYFSDFKEVADRVFVILKDNYAVKQVRKKYPNTRFIYVDTVQQELDYILENKAYGTIVSIYSSASMFNNERERQLKVAGVLPPEYDDIASLATRKENQTLHSILTKSLIATSPREIEEFMSQGAVVSYDPDVDYRKYWWIAVSVVLLVIILSWWNRYLKRINAKLRESQQKLELLSETDPLTNVYNRLKMDDVFAMEIRNSERYQTPLSVIMLDIDYFKTINDNFGHVIGDRVLVKIAKTTKANLRINDFLGRWGGEEFLVVCPSTGLTDAILVAEKLRASLVNTEFEPVKKVTGSFGVAEWKDGEAQESLISRADSALYRSKELGRNRVSS
jgi:diguanylate cyclase (GGDEF)-like protein